MTRIWEGGCETFEPIEKVIADQIELNVRAALVEAMKSIVIRSPAFDDDDGPLRITVYPSTWGDAEELLGELERVTPEHPFTEVLEKYADIISAGGRIRPGGDRDIFERRLQEIEQTIAACRARYA